jgi:tRNA dimethylallyltransferase
MTPTIPRGPRPLIVIVGPTASGKSALAIDWAQQLGTEIISADAVQVHAELDIGSAKPSPDELAAVPHHLVSVLPPTERPSAGWWVARAEAHITELHKRNLVPIVCGGTGLYVRALLEGLAEIPEVPTEIREAVHARMEREGCAALHAELAAVDPEASARILPTDPQRVGRALEVFLATGRPISSFQTAHRADRARREPRYDAHLVGLFPDRETLSRRIEERARAMFDRGLVAEVEGILARHGRDCPGLETLGYREVVATLRGVLPASDLPARLATAHRRYAKRQVTWWRDAAFDTRLAPSSR